MRKRFDVQIVGAEFRKWEIIKTYGHGTGIVIKTFKEAGATTLRLYPYKRPKNKTIAFLKFQWLKFRVFFKII
jgi:hypothetical protein